MRRLIIITSLIGSFVVFGITSGLFMSTLLFLILGEVPGMRTTLSPSIMLLLWLSVGAMVTAYLLRNSLFGDIVRHEYGQQRKLFRRNYNKYIRRTRKALGRSNAAARPSSVRNR